MDKSRFFEAATPKTERVEIAEGETLTIRQLSAAQLTAFVLDADGQQQEAARSIVASVVDASGEPMFTNDDIPQIMALSAAVITKLSRAIARLNGLTDDTAKN